MILIYLYKLFVPSSHEFTIITQHTSHVNFLECGINKEKCSVVLFTSNFKSRDKGKGSKGQRLSTVSTWNAVPGGRRNGLSASEASRASHRVTRPRMKSGYRWCAARIASTLDGAR